MKRNTWLGLLGAVALAGPASAATSDSTTQNPASPGGAYDSPASEQGTLGEDSDAAIGAPSGTSGTSGSSAGSSGSSTASDTQPSTTTDRKSSEQGSTFSANQVVGEIKSIDKSSKSVTIDQAGTSEQLKVSENATIFMEGKLGAFDDLKEGQQVRAAYEEKGADKSVRWLEVTPAASKSGQDSKTQKSGAGTESGSNDATGAIGADSSASAANAGSTDTSASEYSTGSGSTGSGSTGSGSTASGSTGSEQSAQNSASGSSAAGSSDADDTASSDQYGTAGSTSTGDIEAGTEQRTGYGNTGTSDSAATGAAAGGSSASGSTSDSGSSASDSAAIGTSPSKSDTMNQGKTAGTMNDTSMPSTSADASASAGAGEVSGKIVSAKKDQLVIDSEGSQFTLAVGKMPVFIDDKKASLTSLKAGQEIRASLQATPGEKQVSLRIETMSDASTSPSQGQDKSKSGSMTE